MAAVGQPATISANLSDISPDPGWDRRRDGHGDLGRTDLHDYYGLIGFRELSDHTFHLRRYDRHCLLLGQQFVHGKLGHEQPLRRGTGGHCAGWHLHGGGADPDL